VSAAAERATARLDAARRRSRLLDHVVRAGQHYGRVQGSQWAGAITYYGFLSFFPILALAFAVVALLASVYPDGQDDLTTAVNALFPGLIGTEPDQISLAEVESAARTVAGLGLLALLYSGLSWFSSMRVALAVVFEVPLPERPSWVLGKVRDLVALLLIGVALLLAVALTGFVTGFSSEVLDWVGVDSDYGLLLRLVTLLFGLAANTVLFYALFLLPTTPHAPRRDLWAGALVGAVGFEVLKQLSGELLGLTKDKPAFQAFGVALILLVWINFFSRVVILAAAWAHEAPASRAVRDGLAAEQAREEDLARVARLAPPPPERDRRASARAFAAGGATVLTVVAALRRPRRKDNP
jgi:membrane protein